MKSILFQISKLWDRFGPVPVEYCMFELNKNNKKLYSVYMLRGNIKVRIGPLWTGPGDCLRFMESLNTKEEACYE